MSNRTRQILAMTALVLAASALSGCGTINEKLASGAGYVLPVWAGGEPSDVPPRQGTPEYDAWMKERERKRLLPAAERGDDTKGAATTAAKPATSSSQDAVH